MAKRSISALSNCAINGNTVHLTLMEAKLLRHLIQQRRPHRVTKINPRGRLGPARRHDTRAIDNFIVRLRRYIEEDPANPKYLLTVRGIGYRFVV